MSYNNQIKAMASARVKVVDMYPLIKKYNDGNGPGDMADCRHPDQSGYEKMGTAWYNSALASLLTSNPVTVPTAPRNVTAVAGNGQATVSFDPPSSNGGAAVTEYTVTSTPGNITKVGGASPLTVTGLTNGTNYTFTVKAKNSQGYGPVSEPSNLVKPVAGVTVPGAPTIGTATAGDGQATVTFTAPANNGGAAVTEYTVTSTPGNKTKVGSGSPLTVTGLTNGTNYTFKVKAKNSAGYGAESQASNGVTPTGPPPGDTTYLSDLNATPGSGTHQKNANALGNPMVLNGVPYAKGIGVNSITTVTYALNGQYKNFITDVGIDDSCAGGNKANIQIVVDSQIVGPTGTSAIFTTSSPTLPLSLDVTGKSSLSLTASGAGDGTVCDRIDWANARLTTTTSSATAPGAPTIGTATAGDKSATVHWTAPASDGGSPITAYVIYTDTGTANPVGFTGPGTTQAPITGLINGTQYQFTVRAVNNAGTSPAVRAVEPCDTAGRPCYGSGPADDRQRHRRRYQRGRPLDRACQ